MSAAVRSAIAAAVVLGVLGVMLRDDPRELGATTFGRLPSGHGGVFDLFVELDIPTARSYAGPGDLDPGLTVWWVEPWRLCHASESAADAPESADEAQEPAAEAAGALVESDAAAAGDADAVADVEVPAEGDRDPRRQRALPAAADRVALEDFVAAGGTALVFLGELRCPAIAGVDLPLRSTGEAEDQTTATEEVLAAALLDEHALRIDGPVLPHARELRSIRAAHFFEPGDWRVVARVDGEPFALERAIGDGRLVVVADAFFLRNRGLATADAAPLVIDLVRAYGAPLFDEHQHDLRLESGTLAYLAGSPAALGFSALAVLGLLVFWWGKALPALPAVTDDEPPAPALDGFVSALAGLYARTRDHDEVAERYRLLALARLRRHFGFAPGAPADAVVDRVERLRPDLGRTARSLLAQPGDADGGPVRNAAGLHERVRALDRIVEEVCV